jgi:spermidine synthase
VIDYGSRRALYFVGDKELDLVETLIDLQEPYRLQHPYTQAMTAGLVYRPDPSSVLLVGLGGGALVRFLNHYFPAVQLDVVEIDPAVVEVARDYFGTWPAPGTRILVADGRDFLARSTERYDLILLDAHLYPSELTDGTGHPLSLRTEALYRSLHERLRPGGVVLINMIAGRDGSSYMAGVCRAFAAVDVLAVAESTNRIVVATADGPMPEAAALRHRARSLDQNGNYGFSFERQLDIRTPRERTCQSR